MTAVSVLDRESARQGRFPLPELWTQTADRELCPRSTCRFTLFYERKTVSDVSSSRTPTSNACPKQVLWFAWFGVALTLAFAWPLFGLLRYALSAELHSHALLIPFISAYLVWLERKRPLPAPSASPALAIIPFVVGLVALKVMLFPAPGETLVKPNDYFALTTFGYLCFLWAGALLFLGGSFVRGFLFPAAFLIFLVPLPTSLENQVEIFFQHTSAEAAAALFSLSGMSFFREGLVFELPGIALQVAQECSGIRSSLVLFITSLLAGHLFLQSPVRRTLLALFVIPLAIVRNGFRIFTIGMLCVQVDPAMVDSWIHKRGGPLFFGLSLIPFFLLLFWLRRQERSRAVAKPVA